MGEGSGYWNATFTTAAVTDEEPHSYDLTTSPIVAGTHQIRVMKVQQKCSGGVKCLSSFESDRVVIDRRTKQLGVCVVMSLSRISLKRWCLFQATEADWNGGDPIPNYVTFGGFEVSQKQTFWGACNSRGVAGGSGSSAL